MKLARHVLRGCAPLALVLATPAMAESGRLPDWSDYVEMLKGIAQPLLEETGRDKTDALR